MITETKPKIQKKNDDNVDDFFFRQQIHTSKYMLTGKKRI